MSPPPAFLRAETPLPVRPGRSSRGRAQAPWQSRGARPHLYLGIFGAWALALLWFHPRLASLLDLARTPAAWAAVAFFVLFTEVAWLYGFFNLGVVLFAAADRRRPGPAAACPVALPSVAVLYTTCNDFVEESALSCVRQDYPSFTVYLLDDSTDPDSRTRVDAFAARHRERVRVVRRGDRRGFKAGNLNHALSSAARGEPLFALADADEILPPDFLRRTAARLLADDGCGFVQASHACRPGQPGALARILGPGIDSHWRWYQPLRNRYGFVMLLGHGALVRRQAWEAVGGFPELVSEDLAFALRIRAKGWRGFFAQDVLCREDFPGTIRDFRARHMKWTRGTCEFLSREMFRALGAPSIPLVEKLDVLFPTLNLPMSIVWFLFVLDANVLLVALFGRIQPLTLALGARQVVVPTLALDPGFRAILSPDFFAITLLTLLSPVLCFILDMWRTPLALLRFLSHSTAVYGALGPLSSLGVALYAATGKAVFHVTGDRGRAPRSAHRPGSGLAVRMRSRAAALLHGSHPDHPAVQCFEAACGSLFAALGLWTMQIPILGLALAFGLLPLAHHLTWESRLIQALAYLPLALLVAGTVLGGLSLFGTQAVLFGFGFHF